MAGKTHRTAAVLIPPKDVWQPIQSIRARYDRQVRRWMPHVTLLYPFRPRHEFDDVVPALAAACRNIEPFEVRLDEFRSFRHGRASHTLWLAPEPQQAFTRLQSALQQAVPECDDVARHPPGFTPHLSVGQARDDKMAEALKAEFQSTWAARRGVVFRATEVSLIWRNPPPDDLFRLERVIPLGREY
jgi:2'-5' RNA ligase